MRFLAISVFVLSVFLVAFSVSAETTVANAQAVNYTFDGACRITSLTGTRTTMETGTMTWACSGRFSNRVTTKIEFDPGYPPQPGSLATAVPYATVTQNLAQSGTALGRALCVTNPITGVRLCDASPVVSVAPNQLGCRIDGGVIYCPGWSSMTATTSTGAPATSTVVTVNPVGAPTSGTVPVKVIPTSGSTQTSLSGTSCIPLVGRIIWDVPGQTCLGSVCTPKTASQVVAVKLPGCP